MARVENPAESVTNGIGWVRSRMRSRASIKGHPIHPALIPFPFAFLYGAVGFDILGHLTGNESFWTTGAYLALAGIGAAMLAAVPGFIDYVFTVPPNSSGKARATKHMLVNLTAVALFAIAWVLRGSVEARPELLQLLLEGAGAGLLTVGGWMGGTLAYRNQIGVDHRYARAGKWKEERAPLSAGGVVTVSGELEIDQIKLLHVDGRRIVLARTSDGYVAFDDRCTHKGGSLAGGMMMCGRVQCPWHGSQFDVSSGAVKAGPAEAGIETFPVERNGKELVIRLKG
jgi:uncharacterized membrane protein/nitrite reductase/ring-hydroxylating ferredoxin subunit